MSILDPGELIPGSEQAVDGMYAVFVGALRYMTGPGSGELAEHAWQAWRRDLLAGRGTEAADESAQEAAVAELCAMPEAIYFWITERGLRRAVRLASATATSCR
jgi:hypothetical protein